MAFFRHSVVLKICFSREPFWKGRLSMVDLLFKIGCFVKKKNKVWVIIAANLWPVLQTYDDHRDNHKWCHNLDCHSSGVIYDCHDDCIMFKESSIMIIFMFIIVSWSSLMIITYDCHLLSSLMIVTCNCNLRSSLTIITYNYNLQLILTIITYNCNLQL